MKLRSIITAAITIVALLAGAGQARAQFNLSRLIQGIKEGVQAVTLSNDDIVPYISQYVAHSDSVNEVLPATDPYSQRLARITRGITSVDGIPLNFKVYKTDEVNAFACADGSVRVYTGLMDRMTDDEVLSVIGHEIGHVAHHDSRDAFKQAMLNSAVRNGLASTSSTVAALTDSQLAAIGDALLTSKHSRKQEQNADDYGYQFLKATGHNPTTMISAFQKLQAMEQQAGAQSTALSQLFSSHPDVGSRISRLTKMAKKDGYNLTAP
ncbi:MAG: M48 family metallopeptidase [Paramuribaculum sp.]|nr:M48 family metallopeptidase [Paramuribaculum sp.]